MADLNERTPDAATSGVQELAVAGERRQQGTPLIGLTAGGWVRPPRQPLTFPQTLDGVTRALGAAHIDDLLEALTPPLAPSTDDRWSCPTCNPLDRHRARSEPTAYPISATRWTCSACHIDGTIFGLRHAVATSGNSLDRLLDVLAEEVPVTRLPEPVDPWEVSA